MPTDTARRNHDELFPGHVSTLAQTDPELIEYFDNFAFDEVLRHGDLATRTRLMVQLAAMIACQALRRVPGHARRRADRRGHPGRGEGDRLPGRAVRRHGQGLRLPARHQRRPHRTRRRAAAARASRPPRPRPRMEKGLAVQKQIVGDERRRRACTRTRPRTSSTSSATCRRTASATTSPVAASTCRPANCSPSRCSSRSAAASRRSGATSPANLNVGNDRARLLDVLTQLLPFIGYPRTLNGLRVLDEVTLPKNA